MSRGQKLSGPGLFLATLFWGASFFLVKKATSEVGLWPFLLFRFSIAAGLLAAVFPKRTFRAPRSLIRKGLTLGIVLFVTVWTQTQGLQLTTATRSGFITALYVPFTPLVGWILFRQPVFFRQILVACVAVTGLYFLTCPRGEWRTWLSSANVGDLWTLAAASAAAVHIILTERFTRTENDSVALGIWQFTGCTLCVIFSVLGLRGDLTVAGVEPLWNLFGWPVFAAWAVAILSVLCTAFAFIMQIVAQKYIGSLKAALIFALEAPFSSGFAFTFLGEVMTSRELAGASLVFLTSVVPESWLKEGDSHGPL